MKLQRYLVPELFLRESEGAIKRNVDSEVVKHYEALDWFESLLVPQKRSHNDNCDCYECNQRDRYSHAVDDLRALIAAERGKG